MGHKAGAYGAWAARWRVPLGFGLSLAYLLLAQPTVPFLAAGGAVAFGGLLLRGWAAGHLEKGSSLATAGPYALTRNPLYLGSTLIGAGFALAGRSLLMVAAFALLLILIYGPVIRREEQFLRDRFGDAYRHYEARVPLFLPRLVRELASNEKFQWSRYKKNREYEAALGYAGGLLLLVLKMIFWPGFAHK
ncbi:MAG TPA: isoprenylcysteine carboxylmethyltransferase family protein [Terriglobia bacterium]|nr:isoprenylcysteine carboxylmethyltransferase family protein [Terriglobia bacterium]